MSTNKSSSTKGVNRARKANGLNNKTRSSPNPQRVLVVQAPRPRRQQSRTDEKAIALGRSFSMKGMKSLVVPHTELVGALSMPVPDGPNPQFKTLYRLRLNPGSESTFPWLSRMAPNFEFYRFRRLAFKAITRCPTTSTGSLVMSPDFDAADGEVAITEQFIFSNKGSTDSPVWKEQQVVALDPASMNRLYKSHSVMSDLRFSQTKQDQKTIDVGQLFVCSDTTIAAGTSFGKLVVDYEVEFFNPCAPTEQVNEGGAKFQISGSSLNNAETFTPIRGPLGGFTQVSQEDILPILEPDTTISSSTHTGVIGKFARDWQGVLQLVTQGTALGSLPQIQVDTVNGASGQPTAINQPLVNSLHSLNGGATLAWDTYNVSGLAGQYLKLQSYTNTALGIVDFVLGGASRTVLL